MRLKESFELSGFNLLQTNHICFARQQSFIYNIASISPSQCPAWTISMALCRRITFGQNIVTEDGERSQRRRGERRQSSGGCERDHATRHGVWWRRHALAQPLDNGTRALRHNAARHRRHSLLVEQQCDETTQTTEPERQRLDAVVLQAQRAKRHNERHARRHGAQPIVGEVEHAQVPQSLAARRQRGEHVVVEQQCGERRVTQCDERRQTRQRTPRHVELCPRRHSTSVVVTTTAAAVAAAGRCDRARCRQ
mmetsp:Transcript_560/g.773  ORF Transcript_560/g.773 Transcript_560/m.773 type:complete len:252 (-) Transcript_560:580-1335(-)